MKCRVFYKSDGSIAVVHVVTKFRQIGETDDQLLDRMANKTVAASPELQGAPYEDMEQSALPSREHRNKWRHKQGRLHVDHSIETKGEKLQRLDDELKALILNPKADAMEVLRKQYELKELRDK